MFPISTNKHIVLQLLLQFVNKSSPLSLYTLRLGNMQCSVFCTVYEMSTIEKKKTKQE